MKPGDAPEDAPDWAATVVVQCPECGHEFETHDLGDLVGCGKCDSSFERFDNIIEGEIS
jgi:protein-arginine kinase activator protein McsA